MNQICQLFILCDEIVGAQPHHAAKVVIVEGDTGKSCDNLLIPAVNRNRQ